MPSITIDPVRFLGDLKALRAIGAVGTGVVRPAFSDKDIEARRWLAGRMVEAGLEPVFDPVGNLFGLPESDGPCLLMGSHTDTQPEGGWLDGALGVIAALEVSRASREAGGPPVAVISFQDEEGRFGTLTGSRIWSGELSLEEADKLVDLEGNKLGDLRRRMGDAAGATIVGHDRFSAYVEAHIEQGPVLDESGETVGIVEGIVGIRQATVTLEGQQNHAGTTPMALRRDAVTGFRRIAERLDHAFKAIVTPDTVWTFGHVSVHPSAASIVPGRATFTIQWRDRDTERLDRMQAVVEAECREVTESLGLGCTLSARRSIAPKSMTPALVDGLAQAAEACAPGRWRRMVSGALHDASNLAGLMPTAMVFTPSIGGVSHSFEEDTAADDLVMCTRVLARFVEQGA